MTLNKEQIEALRAFAEWLRAKNDTTQERLEREEAEDEQ